MKKIAILGSTGSIGVQSLDVAEKQNYKVTALTANTNVKKNRGAGTKMETRMRRNVR